MGFGDETDEIVHEFLVESRENLDRYDQDLLNLERNPEERSTLDSLFRTVHTIKGTCGFLGFGQLELLTHKAENLLSGLREGAILPRADLVTVLLQLGDELRTMLDGIEASGNEPPRDHGALMEALANLAKEKAEGEETKESIGAVSTEPEPAPPDATGQPAQAPNESTASGRDLVPSSPAPVLGMAATSVPTPETRERQATPVPELTKPSTGEDAQRSKALRSEQSIRVDLQTLDKLMNLVGELVLARNQTLQFADRLNDPSLLKSTQRLDAITTELQEGIMQTRMQPLSVLIGKFPRVARDLAVGLGKQVELVMEGGNTELDRTILEAIKDPLTHVLRNSIDHGIESPFERQAMGKPTHGTVRLSASHQNGKVVIEISDDGKGLDPQTVLLKSIERGLVDAAQANDLSEQEVAQLIFLPGFSTKSNVTSLSGRGVGMDVVKTNIEKIGGSVDLENRPGHGVTLRLKLPLTLAIIPALVVSSGTARYAIPQSSLVELLRLDLDRPEHKFEEILGAQVYRLRDRLLPIVWLDKVLENPSSDDEAARSTDVQIVVMQADGQQFGVVVDDINDTQEIVVKPLGSALANMSLFSGATILGDGSIALIINGIGLAKQAGVLSQLHENARQQDRGNAETSPTVSNRETMLLFGVHNEGRMAVPLREVARLEEFPVAKVERVGDGDFVQYRDEIMPLIRIANLIPERRSSPRGESELRFNKKKLSVLVYSDAGRSVGLIVDRILDVVDEELTARRSLGRPGTLGSAVIQGRVTELLDVAGIVRTALNPTADEPMRSS